MVNLVKLVFIWSVSIIVGCTGDITTTAGSGGEPVPWFPNRKPQVFQSGEKTTLYTTATDKAEFWTEDRTSFQFRVKACESAAIALYNPEDIGAPYVVTLGDLANMQVSITVGPVVVVSVLAFNILHCNEARSFWISWKSTNLVIGKGQVIGDNILLATLEFPQAHYTNRVVLYSGLTSNSAVWEVAHNSAAQLSTASSTEEGNGYGSIWKDVYNRNFFTFRVTACRDVHILLTSQQGDLSNKVYEIVLGANLNRKCLIRTAVSGGQVLAETSGGVLACLQPRHFWISWLNHAGQFGQIKVGKGPKYGENVILSAQDPEMPVDVRHLSVNTGLNVKGVWQFDEDIEETTLLRTQIPTSNIATPELLYKNVWIESIQAKSMTFLVTSCSKVAIHLSTTLGVDEEFGVELLISNNMTVLKNMIAVDDLDSELTPNILSCTEPRFFWLTWKDGLISLGIEREPNSQLVVQANAPSDNYYALSLTSYDQPALWTINARSSENIELIDSQDLPTPINMWRTILTKQEMTFQVKACSDVTVLLSPFPGLDSDSYYFRVRLNIGGRNLTIIDLVIGNSEGPTEELARKEVNDLLSCSFFREFYVSWWGGDIKVGKGRYQGRLLSSFITAKHKNSAHDIKAASLRILQGLSADWSIRGDVGDSFIYHTPANGKYQNWITFLEGAQSVSFDITAETDARVLLVEDMLSLESKQIEVVICGWNNTQSVIREPGDGGKIYVNVTHPVGLLDSFNSRTFWIRWNNHTGELYVGGGNPLLDSGIFLSWQNPHKFPITAMAFMTADRYDGHWFIRQHMGQRTLFPTHVPIVPLNGEETWMQVEHTRSLYFNVMAASEVSLVLADHSGITNKDALKLVIGAANNTVTNIQTADGGDIFVQVDTPGILDATTPHDFWLSWTNGVVQFGQGATPGVTRVLNFQLLPVINIRAVRFSTGFGTGDGQWRVKMWNDTT